MTTIEPEHQVFIALVAGVIGITILSGSPDWYVTIALLVLLGGILVTTRTWHDRGFFLVCGGEPLVVACSVMNLWAGVFAQLMVAGIVCRAFGLLKSRTDLRSFALFCGGSILVAGVIQVSNHAFLSFLVLSGIAAVILAVQSVRSYQLRKQYTGA